MTLFNVELIDGKTVLVRNLSPASNIATWHPLIPVKIGSDYENDIFLVGYKLVPEIKAVKKPKEK